VALRLAADRDAVGRALGGGALDLHDRHQARERVAERQDPLGVGVLDGERADRGAPQLLAVGVAQVGDQRADVRPRRALDGEGGAVRPMTLIEDGVITTWLHNASSARQLGQEPNGHATSGHGGPPGIGTSNMFVKPGADDLATSMRNAGKGLFVTDMFSPSLNMNTGDWSVGVAGYWFENGEIAYPVSEVTVAGNLLDIFARLRCNADVDTRGSLEIPSLIVDDLAIGGAHCDRRVFA